MKSVKNDTKYIIKRILIGVGIAIILFNLKKCNVYADSLEYRSFDLSANNITAIWNYSSNDISSCSNNGLLRSFTYGNYKYNICYSPNFSNRYLLAFEYNGGVYVLYGSSNFTTYNNRYNMVITSDNMKILLNNGNNSMAFGYLPKFNQDPNSLIRVDTDDNITSSNVSKLTSTDLYTNNNYENLHLIYSTDDLPVYINQDYEVPDVPDDPLSNLTQIDLTNHYGVLLVPKDYRTMLSDYSTTEEVAPGVFHTNLNLSYYSQYCTRGTLLNVENVQDILMNHTGVGSGSLATTINGTCPEQPTETTLSYQYDMYSGMTSKALFIYNNSLNWQEGFDNNAEGYYGTSYVWYDSTLYNMYIVDSFENFNGTIQYIDYTGQQKEVTIESLPTMEQAIESALDALENEENIQPNTSKLQAIFTFIKTPFTFLSKLNTNSCKAILLPFPHSNQNITINCLSSSVYDRYLPQALKGILIIIINGLLFYRCTLSNIDIVTDILDPEDNKLEAIQL